jgi:hypothetical protein
VHFTALPASHSITPLRLAEHHPLRAVHPSHSGAANYFYKSFVVLGHALGDALSVHDAKFATESAIPAFTALAYFNMTGSPFTLLLWHPPHLRPPPPPHLAQHRAAASSPWLAPLTPMPVLTAADLPPAACFHHLLVGHESAFRVASESDAVRGVALRSLRHALLRHHTHTPDAAATTRLLHVNVYAHSSAAEGIGCKRFLQLLETVARNAVLECVDTDAMESFSAAARAISRAHLHIVPSDLPPAALLLLAPDSSVVFVVHAAGSNPEVVAAALQLLSDMPWLHVTHVWDDDDLLHAKLHEAAEDAIIRAELSTATPGGE